MTRVLNCALIGVGGIGQSHLHTIQSLEEKGQVHFLCVADPFVNRLAENKAALEQKGVRWYADYEEMLGKESDLDAVAICTPIPLHYRMTKAAVDRGLFVYLEKPPVPLIQQLDQLVSLDAERKVAVGFQMIASQLVRQLKQWKVEGALGEVRAIRVSAAWPRLTSYYQRASWAGRLVLDGEAVFDGPATNANAHLVQTIMFLGGETMDAFAIPESIEAELYRVRPIESYDLACFRGKFPSGIEFSCSLTHATRQPVPYHIEIMGTKGNAWLGRNGQVIDNTVGLTNPPLPERDVFLNSYRGFVEFAHNQRPRPYTRLEDTRGYLLATNGAWLSSVGIATVPAEYVRSYTHENDSGYDVEGLSEWIVQAGQGGRLFSEMSIPWARQGKPIRLEGLRSLDLKTS